MKLIPQKVIRMTLFLFVVTILFSCSKDTDLLLDSVLNDPEISLEEKERLAEEVSEDGLVTRTFTFSPTNDAYLQNDQGHDRSIIRLQEDYRTSYLMFDLSEVNGTITDAVLQFSIDSDEGDGSIDIHKGISADWTEETLTINNAPSLKTRLASMNKAYKVGAPEKVSLDVNNLTSEVTTLVMTHSTGNDLAFASKEHPANKGPKLVITYKAPEGSPFIQQDEEDNTQEDNTQEDTTPPQEDNTQEDTTPQEDNTQEDTPQEEEQPDDTTTASTEGAYFVTTSGSSSNNGLSEANAWSIEHAFEMAAAGDVVYIKAGNYGNKQLVPDNSGTANSPIKFIGYTSQPGDLKSNQGSTFIYGESLNANKMPLIKGSSVLTGIGLDINENHVEIHNFQISDYWIGVISKGSSVVLKNIVTNRNGEQGNNNSQTGRGFQIYGDYTRLESCFSLNSNAEGINLKGANNCLLKNTQVYSDNLANMGGYYIAITGGGKNNIVENCTIYRDPSGDANLPHQGHGFILKDQATNNTFRNCKAYNTGIEVNFSGVHSNTFENIEIFGNYSRYNTQHSSCIKIVNGAHDNFFKNINISDTRYAVAFVDFDDGYVGPGGDRDENQGGNNNVFEGLEITNANNILFFNSVEIGWGATSRNNQFFDSTFKNISSVPFVTKQTTSGTSFSNCSFINIPSSKLKDETGSSNKLPIAFNNCNFENIGFSY